MQLHRQKIYNIGFEPCIYSPLISIHLRPSSFRMTNTQLELKYAIAGRNLGAAQNENEFEM